MLIDLLNTLSRNLTFDYDIEQQPDGIYGHMSDNGTWHGVIGALVEKKADIGLGAFSYMAERIRAVDMTDPIWESTGISAIMLKPEPETDFFRSIFRFFYDFYEVFFNF